MGMPPEEPTTLVPADARTWPLAGTWLLFNSSILPFLAEKQTIVVALPPHLTRVVHVMHVMHVMRVMHVMHVKRVMHVLGPVDERRKGRG
jgi:hypothetical protein